VPSHKNVDPLFRGDRADAVAMPDAAADPSLVRHILYRGGYRRATPYLSTSSSDHVAQRFAGRDGRVWRTSGAAAEAGGANHLSQKELDTILKASKRGRARWPNAHERLLARKYVELHAEHLIDFVPFKREVSGVAEAVRAMFEKA
jgi:hypothetical protein